MGKKTALLAFSMLFVGSCFATNALSAGLGFSYSSGGGNSDWEIIDWVFDTTLEERSSSDTRTSISLVFDTTVAKNSIFNYRLNIGYADYEAKIEGGDTVELDGLFMSHDFGFRLKSSENLRVWLGPELRIAFMDGDRTFNFNTGSGNVDLLTVGIGPVLGFNMNFPGSMTFAIKIGYLSMTGVGDFEIMTAWGPDSYDLVVDGGHTFASVGIIFRLGDEYKK